MSNMNGRGSYVSKIDRLIDEHENTLRALKLTRDLLNGDAREKKQNTNRELAKALTKEAHRSHHKTPSKRGPSQKPPRPAHRGHRVIAEQRTRSAAFLAQFDPKVPSRPPSRGKGLGVMIRRGYLQKKGDGYIRTAKPYMVNPKQAAQS